MTAKLRTTIKGIRAVGLPACSDPGVQPFSDLFVICPVLLYLRRHAAIPELLVAEIACEKDEVKSDLDRFTILT